MVAPARNKVAAAAAIAAPDLEVIFMSISSIKKWNGAPPRRTCEFQGRQGAPSDSYAVGPDWLHSEPDLFQESDVKRFQTMRAQYQYRARFVSIRNDQLLASAPPFALHCASVAIAKPWVLQAFRPLQEFAPLLQALWPLQALTPMHLPWAAAFALVDPVDTTAPARNRVAAAAASVAPDLEFNFMTISSMIV